MSDRIDNISYLRDILKIESSWQEANKVWYIYLMTRRKDADKDHGYDNKMIYRGTVLNEKDYDEKTTWLKDIADKVRNCRLYISASAYDIMKLVLHTDQAMHDAMTIYTRSSRKDHLSLQDRKAIIGMIRSSSAYEDSVIKPERLIVDFDTPSVGVDPKIRMQMDIMRELLEDYPVLGAYNTPNGRHFIITRKDRYNIEEYINEKVLPEFNDVQRALFFNYFSINANPLALLYYSGKGE